MGPEVTNLTCKNHRATNLCGSFLQCKQKPAGSDFTIPTDVKHKKPAELEGSAG